MAEQSLSCATQVMCWMPALLGQDSTQPLGPRAGQSLGHPSCLSAEVPGQPETLSYTVKSEEKKYNNFLQSGHDLLQALKSSLSLRFPRLRLDVSSNKSLGHPSPRYLERCAGNGVNKTSGFSAVSTNLGMEQKPRVEKLMSRMPSI